MAGWRTFYKLSVATCPAQKPVLRRLSKCLNLYGCKVLFSAAPKQVFLGPTGLN